MKKDLHPKYDFVVFEDTSTGEKFLGISIYGILDYCHLFYWLFLYYY